MKLFRKKKDKNKQEDIFISILKYGVEKAVHSGITQSDIYNLAYKKGFLTREELNDINQKSDSQLTENTRAKKLRLYKIFSDNSFCCGNTTRTINLDSYFKYIDYIELQEARESSAEAKKYARIAIWISIITMILSVIISFIIAKWQIDSPVEIKNPIEIQSNQIDLIENQISSQEEKIDQIIKNQESITKTLNSL